jgi:hypothetical protein
MFVIINLQTIYHIVYVYMFIFSLSTKFHIPSSNVLLFITSKLKAQKFLIWRGGGGERKKKNSHLSASWKPKKISRLSESWKRKKKKKTHICYSYFSLYEESLNFYIFWIFVATQYVRMLHSELFASRLIRASRMWLLVIARHWKFRR